MSLADRFHDRSNRLDYIRPPTEAERRSAALAVCGLARGDAAAAALVLRILDIVPPPPGRRR